MPPGSKKICSISKYTGNTLQFYYPQDLCKVFVIVGLHSVG